MMHGLVGASRRRDYRGRRARAALRRLTVIGPGDRAAGVVERSGPTEASAALRAGLVAELAFEGSGIPANANAGGVVGLQAHFQTLADTTAIIDLECSRDA